MNKLEPELILFKAILYLMCSDIILIKHDNKFCTLELIKQVKASVAILKRDICNHITKQAQLVDYRAIGK